MMKEEDDYYIIHADQRCRGSQGGSSGFINDGNDDLIRNAELLLQNHPPSPPHYTGDQFYNNAGVEGNNSEDERIMRIVEGNKIYLFFLIYFYLFF